MQCIKQYVWSHPQMCTCNSTDEWVQRSQCIYYDTLHYKNYWCLSQLPLSVNCFSANLVTVQFNIHNSPVDKRKCWQQTFLQTTDAFVFVCDIRAKHTDIATKCVVSCSDDVRDPTVMWGGGWEGCEASDHSWRPFQHLSVWDRRVFQSRPQQNFQPCLWWPKPDFS